MAKEYVPRVALLCERVILEDPRRLREIVDHCRTHECHISDEHGEISCVEVICEYLRKLNSK
jgi:hypothetical protein